MRNAWLGALLLFAVTTFAAEVPVSAPVLRDHDWPLADTALATDGVNHLVVWRDAGMTGDRIRVALVRRTPFADVPPRVIETGDFPVTLQVAYAAGRYLIVWKHDSAIHGIILDRDATVLRKLDIAATPFGWSLAASDDRFLVTWSNNGTFLSPEGNVLSTFTLPIAPQTACRSAAGTFLLLAPPIVARISADGAIVQQAAFDVREHVQSLEAWSIASASDGGALITYGENLDNPNDPETWKAGDVLLDRNLQRVDPPPSLGGMVPTKRRTTTLWDGSRYVVAMSSWSGLSAMRIGVDAVPDVVPEGSAGALAVDGSGYFVLLDPPPNHSEPIRATFRSKLSVEPDTSITFPVVPDESTPSLALAGPSLLVGWGGGDAFPNNLALHTRAAARIVGGGLEPRLAFDGSRYVVTWGGEEADATAERDVTAQFFSADGEALSQSIDLGITTYALWNGSSFFVFTAEYPDYRITRFRIVSAAGATIADKLPFPDFHETLFESMATNGSDVFVVIFDGSNRTLVRVTAAGAVTVGDVLPFDHPKVAATKDAVYVTGTARDASKRVVIDSYTIDLHRRWPSAIALSDGAGDLAAIAADGQTPVVAWHEGRNVNGARVSREGSFARFAFDDVTEKMATLHVAAASGSVAIAYARQVSDPPYLGAERVFIQWLHTPPRLRPVGR